MTRRNVYRQLLLLQVLFIFGGSKAFDPEASITGLYTGPYFDPLTPRNMTAHLGDEAKLPCTVRQLGDKSVSWVRVRDADILTVDRYTFVGDERFESHYSDTAETWNLAIRYVQERDAGEYECQVSTEPKMSQFFSLRVVIPKVEILPVGDRYVKAGSTVRIDCQITDVVQLPDYIFWYHGDKRVMARHDPNLTVKVKQGDVEAIASTLTIHKVRQEQSGNYTCMPSNLHAASVVLHVINEKHPAAMQTERNGSGTAEAKLHLIFLVLLFLYLFSGSLCVWEKTYCPKPENPSTINPGSMTLLSPTPSTVLKHLSSITARYISSLSSNAYKKITTTYKKEEKVLHIILELIKIDSLPNAQKLTFAESGETKTLPKSCSNTKDGQRLARIEEIMTAEIFSSYFLKRPALRELSLDGTVFSSSLYKPMEKMQTGRNRIVGHPFKCISPISQNKGFSGEIQVFGIIFSR